MAEAAEFPEILHPKKRAFLAAYSRYPSISRASKRAKMDRRSHYNWIADDPAYAKAFARAIIEGADALEDSMMEVAFDGNVTAGIFLLKGLKPDKYRERWAGELTGKDGAALFPLSQLDKMLHGDSNTEPG